MFLKNKVNWGLLVLVAMLSGCVSKEINELEISRVKKVAVIAYTLNLPMPADISQIASTVKSVSNGDGISLTDDSKAAEAILNQVNLVLAKKQNWTVLPIEQLRQNPAYINAYKSTMNGLQNKMQFDDGSQDFFAKGIMDKDGHRLLKANGRAELMKALGVDAIAIVQVTTRLKGFTIFGFGSRKPQANVFIQVYNSPDQRAIWHETIEGEVGESLGITGLYTVAKVEELTKKSVVTALDKIEKIIK